MRITRILLLALTTSLWLLGGFVMAQTPPYFQKATIQIIPANPTTRDNIRALVTVTVVLPNPCYQVSSSPPAKIGNVFKASVIVVPIVKRFCPPVVVIITKSSLYMLGRLQEGSYRFELYGCIKALNDQVCLPQLLTAKDFQVSKR